VFQTLYKPAHLFWHEKHNICTGFIETKNHCRKKECELLEEKPELEEAISALVAQRKVAEKEVTFARQAFQEAKNN
jgi:hypothetical protein